MIRGMGQSAAMMEGMANDAEEKVENLKRLAELFEKHPEIEEAITRLLANMWEFNKGGKE